MVDKERDEWKFLDDLFENDEKEQHDNDYDYVNVGVDENDLEQQIVNYEIGPCVHVAKYITKDMFMKMCDELKNTLGYVAVLPEQITEGGILFITNKKNEYKSMRIRFKNWPLIPQDISTWRGDNSLVERIEPGDASNSYRTNTFLKFFVYTNDVDEVDNSNAFSREELEEIFDITEKYGISKSSKASIKKPKLKLKPRSKKNKRKFTDI